MSENLDLVRSIYADWERGDFRSAEWADPQIDYVRADVPEPGTWSGLAGMAEVMRTVCSALQDLRADAEDFRELDTERVLVLDKDSARGKASGLPTSIKGARLFEIHDGKVTRLVVYKDRDRALADLGLEE